EEVARAVRMAALPMEQLQRLKEAAARQVKERKPLLPEQALAMELAEPVSRALAQMLGRLSAEQWALLQRGEPLNFATEPGAGEMRLPEEMARLFRAARPEMNIGTSAPNEEI